MEANTKQVKIMCGIKQLIANRSVKLISTKGHMSVIVALKGPKLK